ncbi:MULTISPECIES: HemK2/MTQ2 family protein methyltransferase [Halococcus]|uniref:Methyltransferase n=1 Tax=Halococcus salifodinae DSM 8989 TaxID=1227456 RepID=M0MTL3_9EURY|nr:MULTISPECIES: HemK2/MTQ2 family protein methyltransferase [Halococcus]EMA49052.1 methyltransferase [Halococcus salifodinae DSM 8989]
MGLDDRRERDDVYQPAEDSDLLATAATADVTATDRALDVGTGSGYVAAQMQAAGAQVVGVDRNPHACRQAREAGIDAVRADLTTAFAADAFDLVTFNPPYLPTEPDEAADDWMGVALSGGETGRAVIEPFLADVGRVLAPDGRVLLLVSSLAGVETIVDHAAAEGFASETVTEDPFPFETLSILRLVRD